MPYRGRMRIVYSVQRGRRAVEKKIAEIGEFGLIDRLRRLLDLEGCQPPGLSLGIGDDAALLQAQPGCQWAVTCDVLAEGRHYLSEYLTAFQLGKRAMAVNLSDIAAMGGQPRYALVALGLRGSTLVGDVENWYRGFAAALNPWDAAIVGGNMTQVDGSQFISITLMGEVPAGQALRRSGASPGQAILVTGYPGQAAAGLRLLQERGQDGGLEDHPLVQAYTSPMPRVGEGRAMAGDRVVSAAIDTSDGFLGDLGNLCAASGVGARLWAAQLPLSPALRAATAKWGEDPVRWFLGPSDDYELIVTCAPEQVEAAKRRIAGVNQAPVHQVGVITPERDCLEIEGESGLSRLLRARGWDHFTSRDKEI
ncbi:MAG: thiamine-phosphate kinase [Candidatus Latescibacteria bacterium]|nr:thiamine-phosphate kinase [Candidatus Latescibacterota bacterium]